LKFEPNSASYFEAGMCGKFSDATGVLAEFGKVSTEIARDYKLRETAWVAVINLERLLAAPLRNLHFTPFSKFPAVERDFSLLVPQGILYERIERAVRALALEGLQGIRPVDRMPEGKIAAGHYSLLLRITFQSMTQTLTSQEVEGLSKRVLAALESLGARLRT
jgi:phenylalanyl-tRNA synthetase beta chain